MISSPRPGQVVQLWYRTGPNAKGRHSLPASAMPHHGRIGPVVVAARGPGPRNHGVMLDGVGLVVVPAGNLRKPPAP